MEIRGNFDTWTPAFPLGLLPQVFSAILSEWPNYVRPSGKPIENRITNRFVGHLTKNLRKGLPFAFDFRKKLADASSDSESGEIDIAVRTSIYSEEYFAFECKRLNVLGTDGGVRSEASEYTGPKGMGCFLTGQYDGGSRCGGMLGYIMDDDVEAAEAAVDASISKRLKYLKLLPPEKRDFAEIMPTEKRVTQTKHLVKKEVFIVYHLFLPFHTN